MQADPITEWQRLTQHYREMNDGELEELYAGKSDLTEVAQQVLSDEVKKRGLDEPRQQEERKIPPERDAAPLDGIDSPMADGATEESEPPVEYTWKTMLCECEDQEEAWQIQEVLRGAGIESWIDRPGYYVAPGIGNLQIMVAADQLEKAHEITSRPIPQEIVEQSRMDIPDYVPPVCPSCGAEDPLLESADPVNSWRCETCGRQWTEKAEDAKESSAQPQSTHRASEEENPFAPGPLTML
jgi:ribosomal protein L37AE/L43A